MTPTDHAIHMLMCAVRAAYADEGLAEDNREVVEAALFYAEHHLTGGAS